MRDEEGDDNPRSQDVTFTLEELRRQSKEDLGMFGSNGEGLVPGFGYDTMDLPAISGRFCLILRFLSPRTP